MKRLLVLLMTGTLCFSMLPGNVMAAEIEEETAGQSDAVEMSEEAYDPASLLVEDEEESETAALTGEESVAVSEDVESEDFESEDVTYEDTEEDMTSEEFWVEPVDADGNPVDTYVLVQPSEEKTLYVSVHGADTANVTYEWYERNDEGGYDLIAGATASSYTAIANKTNQYECRVQDDYGNETYVYFDVVVDNNLNVYAKDYVEDILVSVNEETEIEVVAEADDTSGLTYEWYYYVTDSSGISTYHESPDNGPVCTVVTDETREYWCRVTDRYGNESSVYFNVRIDNDFYAWASESESQEQNCNVFVEPNVATTLHVEAQAKDMSGITYRWYKWSEEPTNEAGEHSWGLVTDADGDSYTITTDKKQQYACQVTDRYGTSYRIEYNVYLEGEEPDPPTPEIEGLIAWDADSEPYICNVTKCVGVNEPVTLNVAASASDMSKVTYTWYGNVWDDEIGGYSWQVLSDATGASYEVTTDRNMDFECFVEDGSGFGVSVIYHVEIDNHFMAWPDGVNPDDAYSTDIMFTPGDEVTLKVNVNADDTSGLSYRWSSSYEDDLSEASDAQLVVKPDSNGYYYCEVTDRYGNSGEVWFYLNYDNEFRAVANGGDEDDPQYAYLTVPYGDSITLDVIAEAKDTSKMTYTWYGEISDYTLTDESVASYTTTVENDEEYRCLVEDGYGNQRWIYFFVNVDNQLKAWPEGAKSEDEHDAKVVYQSGQPVDLKVNVTAGNMDGITYNWSSSNGEDLSDIMDGQITVYPEANGYYHCEVRDQYGNYEDVWFYLVYDNGFSAVAEGGTAEDPTIANITVNKGESLDLHVLTEAKDNSNLSWTWYGETSDYVLSKENSPTLTVNPEESDVYRCLAEDGYGNEQWVYFYVDVVDICHHDLSKVDAKEPTCTTDGNMEYYHCSVCDLYFSDETAASEISVEATILPAYGHDLVKNELEFGSEVYYSCDRCHKYFSDPDGKNEILKPGWVKSGQNWKWRNVDQSYAAYQWIKSGGEWYYIKSNSYMAANEWIQDSGGWCWMDANGKITKNKWIQSGGEWYFIKSNGYMAANEWAQDSAGWCWMDENGKITKNKWIQSGEDRYYLNADGYKESNTWAKDSRGWLLLDKDGKVTKTSGWITLDDGTYYLNKSYYRVSNSWMKDDIGIRWLGEDGKVMTDSWIKYANERYYVNENGYRAENAWVEDVSGWYWMDENGKITKSKWIQDNGQWYYLKANGYMATNEWTKDSTGWMYMDANGKITKGKWIQDNGEWYYLESNGYMATNKWKKDSKGWCYLGSDGKMVTNGWAQDSKGWCWMGADGYWVSNKWIKSGGQWYYIKANHYMAANEWAKDSGGWMYMDANGRITKSKWVKFGGYWYYLKSNGYMATGTQTIGGKTYKFDSAGRWIS